MKTYKVYDKESNSQEFDITVKNSEVGKVYTLSRSMSTLWTNPGKKVLSAIEHGNGVKFSKKYTANMGYSEFAEMYILMAFIVAEQKETYAMLPEYIVMEETQITTI